MLTAALGRQSRPTPWAAFVTLPVLWGPQKKPPKEAFSVDLIYTHLFKP